MSTTQLVSCVDQRSLLCSRILFSSFLFSPFVNIKGFLNCRGMLRGKHGLPLLALLARSRPLSHHWAAGGLLSWICLLTSKHLAGYCFQNKSPTCLLATAGPSHHANHICALHSLTKLPPTVLLVPPIYQSILSSGVLPTGCSVQNARPTQPFCMAGSFRFFRSDFKYHFSERLAPSQFCFFIALVTGEVLIYFCHPCT